MYRLSFVLIYLLCTSLGCGGKPPAASPSGVSETAVPADQLKQLLGEIAKTGEAGSAAAGLRPGIESLNAKDPAKGASLLNDLRQLESMTDREQIKAIAQKMASQL